MDGLIPLRLDHAYVRGNPRSPYWSLAPQLIQQHTDSSCSLATAVMVLNAIRGHEGQLSKIGAPVSELSLLKLLEDEAWRAAVKHETGPGQTLSEFTASLTRALTHFGCLGAWKIDMVPVLDARACLDGLRRTLCELENGTLGFVAVNFHLDLLYGDGSDIGHFSPIGAYDPARDLALILDVYKKDYEPLWTPLEKLAVAMATRGKRSGEARGYAVIRKAG
jgi:hypothetical protein